MGGGNGSNVLIRTEASMTAAAFQTASLSPLLGGERRLMAKQTLFARPSPSCGKQGGKSADDVFSVFRDEHSSQVPPSSRDAPSSLSSTRRSFLSLITIAATTSAPIPYSSSSNTPTLPLPSTAFVANAAETIGKDESCNDASCLGVWDGLLADCPHDKKILKGGGGAGCISSQDDTPGIFAEPWDYSENIPLSSSGEGDDAFKKQMDQLILALETTSRQHGDTVDVQFQEGRYLRALFTDGSSGEKSIGEFYFTPNDTTVQFRIGSIAATAVPFGRSLSNNDRSERIRKSLRYLKVPVLRNRKRTFFFVESDDLDAFGPGSAALGPPEEMSPGEIVLDGAMRYGFKAAGGIGADGRTRRGSDEVDPKMKIDFVEGFPFAK